MKLIMMNPKKKPGNYENKFYILKKIKEFYAKI